MNLVVIDPNVQVTSTSKVDGCLGMPFSNGTFGMQNQNKIKELLFIGLVAEMDNPEAVNNFIYYVEYNYVSRSMYKSVGMDVLRRNPSIESLQASNS